MTSQKRGLVIIMLILVGLIMVGASALSMEDFPAPGENAFTGRFPPGWGRRGFKVGLIRPEHRTEHTAVQGYRQVILEEGFPFEELSPARIRFLGPSLSEYFQALIVPEGANRDLSPEVARILANYAAKGGQLWIGQDAGAESVRSRQILAESAGLTLDEEPKTPDSKSSELSPGLLTAWRVPADSPIRRYYDPQVFVGDELKVYGYPPYEAPRVKASAAETQAAEVQVLAEGGPYPAVTQRKTPGGGWVFYMNARPGEARFRGNDDFLLRVPLKYFLIELAAMPRLIGSPGGKGGLVMAIHVCSGRYIADLDKLVERGLFYREIPISFSITAGPDDDRPGDGKGFDAANPAKGGRIIPKIKPFGSIGSQGGWIHNLWGFHYADIPLEQRLRYLQLNFGVLDAASGTRIDEYAAPGGAHTPDLHDELARLGTKAASIPSAFNSPPTRVWFNGRQEKRFWVFGYSGTQFGNEVENMLRLGRSPAQVVADVAGIFETAARKREIRLFYSHPFELASRPEMWRSIQGEILRLIKEGRLTVETMSTYADFLNRREDTRFEISRAGAAFVLQASNPSGLSEMTIALPTGEGDWQVEAVGSTPPPDTEITSEDGWTYVRITSNDQSVNLRLVRD